MIDRVTSVSVMTDTLKEKIKEYYGIDVDSDLFSPMVDYIFKFIQLPKVDKILDKPVESMSPEEMWGMFFPPHIR